MVYLFAQIVNSPFLSDLGNSQTVNSFGLFCLFCQFQAYSLYDITKVSNLADWKLVEYKNYENLLQPFRQIADATTGIPPVNKHYKITLNVINTFG